LKACGEALGKVRYCSFAGAIGVVPADNSGITAYAAGDDDLALHSALINIQYQYKAVLILILNTHSILILY